MKDKFCIYKYLLATVCALFFIGTGGAIFWVLWNWAVVDIFNAKPITYWQALALLTLGKLVFSGGWKKYNSNNSKSKDWKEGLIEKTKNMTPEEKELFKEEWRKKCNTWKYFNKSAEPKDE